MKYLKKKIKTLDEELYVILETLYNMMDFGDRAKGVPLAQAKKIKP